MAVGWVPVEGHEIDLSDTRVQTESKLGKVVKRVVNRDPNASTPYAILMKIPTELYKEIQAEKQKVNDRIDEAMDPNKSQVAGADYGHFKRN